MTRAGWAARVGLTVLLVAGAMTAAGAASADPGDPDTLAAGETLGSGASLVSDNGAFTLVMQGDGNLVEYYDGTLPLWDSGTGGNPGATAVMQGDGNLVVLSSAGVPLWNAGTFGHPGAYLLLQDDLNVVVYAGSTPVWNSFEHPRTYPWQYTLFEGEELHPGDFLFAGAFQAVMQPDGNFVVYDGDAAVWSSRTSGHPGAYLQMQADGNLVLVSEGRGEPLWSTQTGGSGASELRIQPDGNLVVYRQDGVPTWWRSRDTSAQIVYYSEPQYDVIEGENCYNFDVGWTGSRWGDGEMLSCLRIAIGYRVWQQP